MKKERLQLASARHPGTIAAMLASLFALPATGYADNYDYEVEVSYNNSRSSTESELSDPIRVDAETDDDALRLAGTWYFDGVSASTGPRSRAGFISRASDVSISYQRGKIDRVVALTSTDPAFPSFSDKREDTTNNLTANLRWVWAESGWYGLAGFSMVELELEAGPFSTSFDSDGYSLGVGKYLGAQTAIELRVLRQIADASVPLIIGGSSTSTDAALGFVHIGELGATWQYGTDISLATTARGQSDGSYDARLSLYPSRALAFGIDIAGALQDTSDVATDYEVFASWFPSESLGLAARYGWVSLDEPSGSDLDQYSFGIDLSFRF